MRLPSNPSKKVEDYIAIKINQRIMKEFTKELLSKNFKGAETRIDIAEDNAKDAELYLRMPQKLYLEINREFPYSRLYFALERFSGPTDCFLAGFLCGWAERSKGIK